MIRIICLFAFFIVGANSYGQIREEENMNHLKQLFEQHTESWRVA